MKEAVAQVPNQTQQILPMRNGEAITGRS